MQRHFFSVLLIACFSTAVAQQRLPVFANRQDSIAYEQTLARLADAMKNPRYTFRIDSLQKASARLLERAVRYRTVYRPSGGYDRFGKLPADLKAVKRLSLVNYNGKDLPDSIFLLTGLTDLELIGTRVRKLPARLRELKSLKRIVLMNNRPKGRLRLGKNANLESLAIHDDELDRRPRNYRKLGSLQSLDLSRCSLVKFPSLRGTASLKRLVLAENRLTLDDLRSGLPELEELVLTSNAIQEIPDVIAKFPKLKKLNLNANQVQRISPMISRLTDLEQLSLYKNNLRSLPAAVYELKNLRVIDLYYNQLDELAPAVAQWEKLEILYAANNRLYSLPDNLGLLKNLRELYIHHNRLSNLPASISGMDSLRVLRVNNNLLVTFPMPVLTLSALENLDIASNQLTELPEGLFNLPHLRILSVKDNPFEPGARASMLQWSHRIMQERGVVVHLEGILDPETK